MKLADIVTESSLIKKIKRQLQGWPDRDGLAGGNSPKDLVKRNKEYSDDQIKLLAKDDRNPPKHTPADIQKRVVARELKKRGLDKE